MKKMPAGRLQALFPLFRQKSLVHFSRTKLKKTGLSFNDFDFTSTILIQIIANIGPLSRTAMRTIHFMQYITTTTNFTFQQDELQAIVA